VPTYLIIIIIDILVLFILGIISYKSIQTASKKKIESLENEAKEVLAASKKEAEAAKIAARKRPSCWEYFNNHNPKNATKCDECYRKATQNTSPCWIVDGHIEGISFQFICEDCLECSYFNEYSSTVENPGLMLGKAAK
jgi:hypothetical protein